MQAHLGLSKALAIQVAISGQLVLILIQNLNAMIRTMQFQLGVWAIVKSTNQQNPNAPRLAYRA